MSRSFKKRCTQWIGKKWSAYLERGFRTRVKRACHKAENADFVFDPDRDWEEAYLDNAKLGEWGTADGWDVKPSPDDSQWAIDSYNKGLRK